MEDDTVDHEAQDPRWPLELRLIVEKTLPDVASRLRYLCETGIGYLTLDRSSRTLSGGEYQRARLASALASPSAGALYILDEPTCGLHPRDTGRILESLQRLRDAGATVIVVEHDGDVMRQADWLVDLGPGAGRDGGQLLFAGPPAAATADAQSPTGEYLRSLAAESPGELQWTGPRRSGGCPRDAALDEPALTIRGARKHNLQNLTVRIPLQKLVCVTGVSGSGKSSLIRETLLPVAKAVLRDVDAADRRSAPSVGSGEASARADRLQAVCTVAKCDTVDGLEAIRRVVSFQDAVVGSSPRSCVATLCGLWPEMRRLFARTREARAKGLRAADFSFSSGSGRCSQCRGTGQLSIRMRLLPETVVVCPACRGRRLSPATDAIRFRGLSAADVLELRLDEAAGFFREFSRMHGVLSTFCRLGLGYLALGQPATTFSGGERQRIRLACELAEPSLQPTLFLLDEPTGGLHPFDVSRLLNHLRELVAVGHSVVVIEHQVDVMCGSDWLVDLGPDSAGDGGRICGEGTPSDVAARGVSATAIVLRRRFGL
jgi:excinuclease ABC subunit A